ncbi:sulfite reductase flavoprotein subunit alpha [Brevibacterium sp. 'Marine']|uniref:diflavin oxidoreductase n=1 Tax=Brevibacterium sp. 'Marine' TaxID=2725563 RepID=UPI00145E06EE|nr:sulfite reductase flavoprotein subunit alpha [Brevibacterium sp. 'Marine']
MDETSATTSDLTILFGSETGNAEFLASQILDAAEKAGTSADLLSLDDWAQMETHKVERLLVVTSTYDNGHMPSNAGSFWAWLQRLEPDSLEGLPYAVLAIGDSMYEDFCKAAHDIDDQLMELGAMQVIETIDCDVDFEFTAAEWYPEALEALGEADAWEQGELTTDIRPEPTDDSEGDRVFTTRVSASRRLSGPGSSKSVTHYELSFDEDFEYQPGDSIAVFPENSEELVAEWMEAFDAAESETIEIGGEDKALRAALREDFELSLPLPGLVLALAQLRPENETAKDAVDVIQRGDRDILENWMWDRDVLDIIRELGCLDVPLKTVLAELRTIQHRAYSISSSPSQDANSVHITVSGVEYAAHGRTHSGVASAFLERMARTGEPFRTKLLEAHDFRLPHDDAPVIMIGPGVGVAPFRGFLRHREAAPAKGQNWLFFGDREREHDFLYQDEFEEWHGAGLLSQISLAFSRDQENKHYVHHEMVERADEIREWLDEGAYIFVCGDKNRMARDVDRALMDIIANGANAIYAGTEIAKLKAAGRYVKDVY